MRKGFLKKNFAGATSGERACNVRREIAGKTWKGANLLRFASRQYDEGTLIARVDGQERQS
jgi:hypothetical protein